MANDKNLIEGHEYDGIKELDNPLPNWWLLTFIGTIIFSFLYVLHYHTETNNQIENEYREALFQQESVKKANAPKEEISEKSLLAVAADPAQVAAGKGHYTSRCVACHGGAGEGGIGPNLTDAFWINGKGSLLEIAHVVEKGVVDKGMPAWNTMMSQQEIMQVSAYIATLKGTNPANGKAPQGNKVN